MAASRSMTAETEGLVPLVVGGEPHRKLETAKRTRMVLNPCLSNEVAGLVSAALAQFASNQVPDVPLTALRAKREEKAGKAKKKEVWKATTVVTPTPPKSKPPATVVEELTPLVPKPKGKKGASNKRRQKKEKMKARKSEIKSERLTLTKREGRMEELRIKHVSLLSKYEREPIKIPEPTVFSNTYTVALVSEQEPPAVKDEGGVVMVKWAHKVTVQVPAGPVMRTKTVTEFQEVAVSESQLAWYELNTPILNSYGKVMATELLHRNRKGVINTPHVLQMVTEPEPVLIGKTKVGVQFVTKQVAIPKEFSGETGCHLVASVCRARSQRSERGRVFNGYPRNPGGPVGMSIAKPAPITNMVAENDDTPWDDDLPPPTAVVGEHGFMEEVHKQRIERAVEDRAEHYAWLGIRDMADAVWTLFKENQELRSIRIQNVYRASMETASSCVNPAGLWSLPEYRFDPGPRDEAVVELLPEPKHYVVGSATRNDKHTSKPRARSPLDNIQWSGLSEDAKKAFVAFKMTAVYPDLGGKRIHSMMYFKSDVEDMPEALINGWSEMFEADKRRMRREVWSTRKYMRWLEENALNGDSSYDDGQFDRHLKHQVTDDVTMQQFLAAKERENPSVLYWDSCDGCQANARRNNVYSFAKGRLLTEKERKVLVGELEERGEEAKGKAESAAVTGVKLESVLLGNSLNGLSSGEKDIFLKTLARAEVGTDDLKGVLINSWKSLKELDLDMAQTMFKHWVKKDGGIIVLPPTMS